MVGKRYKPIYEFTTNRQNASIYMKAIEDIQNIHRKQ